MTRQRRRKHRPVGIDTAILKRQNMICACGCGEEMRLGFIDFNHDPPLALREFDEEANDYIPAENDPAFIFAMIREHHKDRTHHPRGKHTVIDSDLHAIRKARNIRIKRLGSVDKGDAISPPKRRGPRLQGRGFDKRLSKRMDGTVVKRSDSE